jgi:hypothetical protein
MEESEVHFQKLLCSHSLESHPNIQEAANAKLNGGYSSSLIDLIDPTRLVPYWQVCEAHDRSRPSNT